MKFKPFKTWAQLKRMSKMKLAEHGRDLRPLVHAWAPGWQGCMWPSKEVLWRRQLQARQTICKHMEAVMRKVGL